jgi:hypothetical protein
MHVVHVFPMHELPELHWVLVQQLPGMHVSVTPVPAQHTSLALA